MLRMVYPGKIHPESIVYSGKDLKEAGKALIMIHGRGGSAEDILSLADYFPLENFALLAPQASNHSWYPYSFMAPVSQNEPWLSAALALIQKTLDKVLATGITTENIYWLGFSQGACLMLEFVARNASKYGGLVAFSGGLIGDRVFPGNYNGDFYATPVFIGVSDPDPHVPVQRVHATTDILKGSNAVVTEKIYPGMGHTISADEIQKATKLVFEVTH